MSVGKWPVEQLINTVLLYPFPKCQIKWYTVCLSFSRGLFRVFYLLEKQRSLCWFIPQWFIIWTGLVPGTQSSSPFQVAGPSSCFNHHCYFTRSALLESWNKTRTLAWPQALQLKCGHLRGFLTTMPKPHPGLEDLWWVPFLFLINTYVKMFISWTYIKRFPELLSHFEWLVFSFTSKQNCYIYCVDLIILTSNMFFLDKFCNIHVFQETV